MSAPLGWILGTFNTAALGLVLLLLVYPRGRLGAALGGLSTATGLALFIALWATTLLTTGRALAGLDWLGDEPRTMGIFYRRALRWGALNGVLFFVVLVAILLTNAIVTAPSAPNVGALLTIAAFYGLFGMLFAFVIGALIGVTLGALDIAALRISRALIRG